MGAQASGRLVKKCYPRRSKAAPALVKKAAKGSRMDGQALAGDFRIGVGQEITDRSGQAVQE